MLSEIGGRDDTASVERKVRAQLAMPYSIDGIEVIITVSIGSAVFPLNAKNRSELLRHVDIAMYRAKANGGASPPLAV